MMMTGLKRVRDWRLLVGDWESRGRSKKTRCECVAEDMRVHGLEQSGVHDRLGWRKGIMGKLSDPCKHGVNRR